MKKDKNIFWEKYAIRSKPEKSHIIQQLKENDVSYSSFYRHCKKPIEKLLISEALLYYEILEMDFEDLFDEIFQTSKIDEEKIGKKLNIKPYANHSF